MGESTGNLAGKRAIGQVLSAPTRITSLDVLIAVSAFGIRGDILLRPGQSVVVWPGLVSMRQVGAGGTEARYTMEPVKVDDAK